MTAEYRTTTVPVRGGDLTVGVWGTEGAPTVLATHGITASHRAWSLLAEAAPDLRIIAPDLRGRGRSNQLPGPWGMPAHAEDMAAVLDSFSVSRCVALGHSMGAFVAANLASRHPLSVGELIMVDGGLPIPTPEGISAEDLPRALIGPAAQRLAMRFESVESYREFWRKHPAFARDWSAAVEDYVDYDLEGTAPVLTPSTVYEAVAEDSQQLSADAHYARALAELPIPVTFLRAPRGLLDEPVALYSTGTVKEWEARMPGLTTHNIAGVNHYTIVMSRRGAEAVLAVVRSAAARVAAPARSATTRIQS